jgi:hypothetical protein
MRLFLSLELNVSLMGSESTKSYSSRSVKLLNSMNNSLPGLRPQRTTLNKTKKPWSRSCVEVQTLFLRRSNCSRSVTSRITSRTRTDLTIAMLLLKNFSNVLKLFMKSGQKSPFTRSSSSCCMKTNRMIRMALRSHDLSYLAQPTIKRCKRYIIQR